MNGFQLPQWDPTYAGLANPMQQPVSIPDWLGTSDSTAPVTATPQLEFGMNIPTFQLGLQGLGTLGSLWGTLQSNKLARDSFNFQKDFAQRNMANQIKSYNTALTDRATTRAFVQGDSQDKAQQYINNNKL